MTAALFDSYLMVDWSAAASPKTGADSIWWAHLRADGSEAAQANPPTRAQAMAEIRAVLAAEADAGRRVLAGFDFPFGYPAGVAARLSGGGWAALWARLAAALPETPDNRTERFAVAAGLNGAWQADGPFWGNGGRSDHPGLPRLKPAGYGAALPPEWRIVERRQRAIPGAKPKSVWQLAGAGSVGSQALTGIAALERLRQAAGIAGRVQVWPFETGLAAPTAPICLAEVYPSLVPAEPAPGEVKDHAQIRAIGQALRQRDQAGALAALFRADDLTDPAERAAVASEEAWILGAGAGLARGAPRPLRYERDPKRIYAQSFAAVREVCRLSHLPDDLHDVALRLVHACGRPETTDRLAWSADAGRAGRAALEAGAPVLCDCEMVASGITRAKLPRANPVLCALNDPRTPDHAQAIGNTRSAAAVEFWAEHIAGAVVAIGNAPTALFHLLELLDAGWPRPALILGFPVGFVGAAESKAELAARPRGTPFLTLRGRAGGSALAAAALNALAAGCEDGA